MSQGYVFSLLHDLLGSKWQAQHLRRIHTTQNCWYRRLVDKRNWDHLSLLAMGVAFLIYLESYPDST